MNSQQYLILITLLSLLVLTTVSVLGANLGFFGYAVQASSFATWGVTGVLGEIVLLGGFLVKSAFKENVRPSLSVSLPQDMAQISIRQIQWDEDKCFIMGANKELSEKVQLIPDLSAPSLQVHFPSKILGKISQQEFLELKLLDKKGNTWKVEPFYLFQHVKILIPEDSSVNMKTKILEDYGSSSYE